QGSSSIYLNHEMEIDQDASRINFDKSVDKERCYNEWQKVMEYSSIITEYATSPNGHSQYSSDEISTPTSSQNWHAYDDIPGVSTPIIDESRQSDYMIENHRKLLESSSKYPPLTVEQQIQIAKYLDLHGEYEPS
ncbi:931_t:CDS:2, partial [Racocetra persica]